MIIEPDLTPIIELIYEAAIDPDRWDAALAAMAEEYGAAAAALVSGNPSADDALIIASTGIQLEVVGAYNLEHTHRDELFHAVRCHPPGSVIPVLRLFSKPDLERTRMHRHLLLPADLGEVVAASVLTEPTSSAVLWLARARGGPPFQDENCRGLRELVPHVGRALSVHNRVVRAQQQAEIAEGAFDRVAAGVVLVDGRGRPFFSNRQARRIADEQDGFSILADGIAAAQNSETRELRSLIRDAGRSDPATLRAAGGGLRLSRPSGRADYQVVVLPLPRRVQPQGTQEAAAVLFITDTASTNPRWDQLARDLYGLTDAEIRLADEILLGRGLTEAAAHLELSRNTVHSQLASIFRKTGTSRQGELILLMLRGPAAVRAPGESSYPGPPLNRKK